MYKIDVDVRSPVAILEIQYAWKILCCFAVVFQFIFLLFILLFNNNIHHSNGTYIRRMRPADCPISMVQSIFVRGLGHVWRVLRCVRRDSNYWRAQRERLNFILFAFKIWEQCRMWVTSWVWFFFVSLILFYCLTCGSFNNASLFHSLPTEI